MSDDSDKFNEALSTAVMLVSARLSNDEETLNYLEMEIYTSNTEGYVIASLITIITVIVKKLAIDNKTDITDIWFKVASAFMVAIDIVED